MDRKDNECITCRCTRKTGEVWIKNKESENVVLCPRCARNVKGDINQWELIKSTAGILDEEEAELFDIVAERLVVELGMTGGSEFRTRWGTFYFTPNK